jgi:aldose sugar dehydrogenase
MKKVFTLLFLSVVAISARLHAQTWQVGNTTLTESDFVTGVNLPWEMRWGQDDYIWCTTRPGKVLRIDPATGNYTIVLTKSVAYSGQSEPGMLGMVLHPDFLNTPKVYIVYDYTQGNSVKGRVSVFDWDGTALINEQILIDLIPGGGIHNGSRLHVAPDNTILMTTGDTDNSGTFSQSTTSLGGKTLRFNLDGSIPADNPDPASYVYSMGHRNSQGLCTGANGIIYQSEHGWNTSDEINIIEPGRNYGWPTVQGACDAASETAFCTANNVREPLTEWTPCRGVSGMEWYDHPAIPEWQNSILLAVLGGIPNNYSRLTVLHPTADGLDIASEDTYFTSFHQRMRDICVNPYTGAVYIALNGGSYPGSGPNIIKKFENLDFVSVAEPKHKPEQNILIYPNPADDHVTFECSASLIGSELEIMSFAGQTVKKELITSSKFELDTREFAAGSYWLTATSASGTVTKTFIKK